ncbi:MAG: UDP-N-acetylglucosamine 1-carboxyvinyltransferase [Candidatus Peregrinibacteria bacterium]|nr:UDP-N-acetylglucosamine 1-carboxyvinyltransferase [Candidatus Peregrinibacteria bacterium]MDZ4245174.1 UDP-N-acetylglucosamine 1-carboxyvinyltransferase [Candidatus Gracilibacteria bacterium]
MSKFLVKGGHALKGTVKISGSKNATLPIMCAALLADDKVTLQNVPRISDVNTMRTVFKALSVKTEWKGKAGTADGNTLIIDPRGLKCAPITHDLVSKMRASSLLLGPLTAKCGKASLAFPGGCVLGKRSMSAHTDGLRQFKAEIEENEKGITIKGPLKSGVIIMPEMSVTATENIIMAAVLTKGVSEIHLAACEPHVQDLCHFLNHLGAKISGIGSNSLVVEGVSNISGGIYSIVSDYLEAGTLALAAVLTRGEVTLEDVNLRDLDFFFYKLKEAGAKFKFDGNSVTFKPVTKLNAVNIKTAVHPGFPTDLQAPFAVLMTQAEGLSEVFETLFEGRLAYLFELEKMGAKVAFLNPHQAKIFGPTQLNAVPIASCDIRAGAAMVLAALIADGETEISNVIYIDRGYEDLEGKLTALGANINRIE